MELVEAAVATVAQRNGVLKIQVDRPQREADVLAVERFVNARYPSDYRDFVVKHGLLTLKFGKGYRGTYAQMFDLKTVLEKAKGFAEEQAELVAAGLLKPEEREVIAPISHVTDARGGGGYYHFTAEPTGTLSLRRLPRSMLYKLEPRATFTEHVEHLLDFVVSWQCPE